MNWLILTESNQLEDITQSSYSEAIIIYKHSTRCGICLLVKKQLENDWSATLQNVQGYYLDLLKYRSLSNEIAEKYGVYHQSPQVLVIKNGVCIYSASHSEISAETLAEKVKLL